MNPYGAWPYPVPQNERMHHKEDGRIHHETHIGCSTEVKADNTKRLDDECSTKKDSQRQEALIANLV